MLDELPNSTICALVDEWIHSKRDRNIIKARLIDGLTFDELSDEFNMSVRRAKSIVYDGIDKILRHIV